MSYDSPSNTFAKILIVEDEILIADSIGMYLEDKGFLITGKATSYEEAVSSFNQQVPDVVLLDIELSGPKTGIDFAHFLRQQAQPPPFLYLTSRMEDRYIEQAKTTFPVGYLGKPIHLPGLVAGIEVALFNERNEEKKIQIKFQGINYVVPVNAIRYLRAEHVYVRFVLDDGTTLLQRGKLGQMLTHLQDERFVQTHRSYVVNIDFVSGYEADNVYVGLEKIPISRSRRAAVQALLGGD